MSTHPLTLPRSTGRDQNVFIHPAALLVALVATSFIVSSEKDVHHKGVESKDPVGLFSPSDFGLLSAVAIAVAWVENQLDLSFRSLQTDHESGSQEHGSPPDVTVDPTLVGSNHIRLDEAFDNATHRLDIPASDLTWASTTHDENLALLQTKVLPLVDQFYFGNLANSDHAPLSTTSTIKPVDAGYGVQALVSELNFNTNPPAIPFLAMSSQPTPMTNTNPPAIPFLAMSSQPTPMTNSQLNNDSGSGSILFANMEATETLHSDLGVSNTNIPIVLTTQTISVDGAIQKAMSQVGYQMSAIQDLVPTNSAHIGVSNSVGTNPANNSADPSGHPSPIVVPPSANASIFASDHQAAELLSAFIQQTPHFQIDVVGRNLVVIDTNTMDVFNSNFSMHTWSMADGSTLTIVGIIPHLTHAGPGGGAAIS